MRYIPRDNSTWHAMHAIYALRHSGDEYNIEPVKSALRQIYYGCCAYCEGKVEPVAYFEIEHFYPKGKYLQWRTNFHNLHFSCPRCNRLKGEKENNTILSPNYYYENEEWVTHPTEIDSCLHYTGYLLFPNADDTSKKGEGTIEMFKLNDRPFLVWDRLRRYIEVYNLLKIIYDVLKLEKNVVKHLDKPIAILFQQVVSYTNPDTAYSTMIIQNFGDEIKKLLSIWNVYRKE